MDFPTWRVPWETNQRSFYFFGEMVPVSSLLNQLLAHTDSMLR